MQANNHFVLGRPIRAPFPDGMECAVFGMGCFWGAERAFWKMSGIYTTAVGYAGGQKVNPTYQEVCSGGTGHAEVVQIVFDPRDVSYSALLKTFWEGHDPTQLNRQGNDIGDQYRSVIFTHGQAQQDLAEISRQHFQQRLEQNGYRQIATQVTTAHTFYYAEDYHQQYLAKNPEGYCGIGGTGVKLEVDELAADR